MLRLLLFVPCEKIITDFDHTVSLISILESITVSGEIANEIAPNAALPMQWVVSILWAREIDVIEPIEFEGKVDVIAPNGEALMSGAILFTVSNEFSSFRNNIKFPAFPIGQQGVFLLKLSGKKVNDKKWEQFGDYPIHVKHNLEGANNENENKIENEQPSESKI